MRKSSVIAHCLVNSNIIRNLNDAEDAVRGVFNQEFPDQDFNKWNANINDSVAANIIGGVGRASRINVKKFIQDIW